MQKEYVGIGSINSLLNIMNDLQCNNPMFVIGSAFEKSSISKEIQEKYENITFFTDYSANPTYESVVNGVRVFKQKNCDFIVAIGGGSAIDVAKCIKAFSNMDDNDIYLKQKITDSKIPFLAVPTTAGTGSEATPFAVIYYKGEKVSVSHESLLPEYVILDGEFLHSLSSYQRKSTMLDALCHDIESMWSVNATEDSYEYAKESLRLIMRIWKGYMNNEPSYNQKMLYAANLAGKAIAISKTTAAHAMSYKMTSLYGISHGHAVGLCIPVVWKYMHKQNEERNECKEKLEHIFLDIAEGLGQSDIEAGIMFLKQFVQIDLALETPKLTEEEEINVLIQNVNVERLKNSPIVLTEKDVSEIYRDIFI